MVELPEAPQAPVVADHSEPAEPVSDAGDMAASDAEHVAATPQQAQQTQAATKKTDAPGQTAGNQIQSGITDTQEYIVDSLDIYDSQPETQQEVVAEVKAPAPWESGLEPIERPGHTGHNQGVISLIVVIVLCLCLLFKNIERVWGSLIKKLFHQRNEQPLEHNTDVERRTILFLLLVAVIFISLLSSAGLSRILPWVFRFDMATTMKMIALVAGLFIFQYIAYWTVGYTFTNDEGRKRWIDGFTAAMTLLGLTLLLPGLGVLFYPSITMAAVYCGIVLYIVARILFICKGFRIFYTNSLSIVYFILYLCSLEIVPITIFFYLARLLCSF